MKIPNGMLQNKLIAFFKSQDLSTKALDSIIKLITVGEIDPSNVEVLASSIRTAAYFAPYETFIAILDLIPEDEFTKLGSIPDNDGRTALYWAATRKDQGMKGAMALITKGGIDFASNLSNAIDIALSIHTAASYGYHEALTAILDLIHENDIAKIINTPHDMGCTALYAAIKSKHAKCVEALMKIDVLNGSDDALDYAIKSGNSECVGAILQSSVGSTIPPNKLLEYMNDNNIANEVKSLIKLNTEGCYHTNKISWRTRVISNDANILSFFSTSTIRRRKAYKI